MRLHFQPQQCARLRLCACSCACMQRGFFWNTTCRILKNGWGHWIDSSMNFMIFWLRPYDWPRVESFMENCNEAGRLLTDISSTVLSVFRCDFAFLKEVVSVRRSVHLVLFLNDEKRPFLCSDDDEILHGPRESQGQFKNDIKTSNNWWWTLK